MMGSRRAVLYLGLVFLLGFALGSLGTYWYYASKRSHRHRAEEISPVRGALKWLTRELDLTSEQEKQLEAILDETAQGYYAVFRQVHPQFQAVRQQGRQKIRAILSEEQRAKFEELVRRIDEREEKMRQKYENRQGSETPEEQSK